MKERYEVKLTQGGEVFEYNGRACYKYNARLKIAGDSAKVTFFENGVMCGFPKNRLEGEAREKSKEEYDHEKRYYKTGMTARKRLHDIVKSNLKVHRDNNGKKQRFKLLTLTFRNDVREIGEANREFKQFIKRLNYAFTGSATESFIKYVAVPELQLENGRGVWHYHLLLFNMPYIPASLEVVNKQITEGSLPSSYDKKRNLAYIWGNGSVKINAVHFTDLYNVAGYIAKYVGKKYVRDENGEDTKYMTYAYAKKHGNLHKKRFLHSEGLMNARVLIAFMDKAQRSDLYQYFKTNCKKFKKGGELGSYFETFSIDSEYVGRMFGIDFRARDKQIRKLEGIFSGFSYGFN